MLIRFGFDIFKMSCIVPMEMVKLMVKSNPKKTLYHIDMHKNREFHLMIVFWFLFFSEICPCYRVQELRAIFHGFLPMAIMRIPHMQMMKYTAHKSIPVHKIDQRVSL